MFEEAPNRRILVVDDDEAILRIIPAMLKLAGVADASSAGIRAPSAIDYEIVTAASGEQGHARVQAACDEGRPYALAIVDVRMPHGWDGIHTVHEMRKVDPQLQVVICTAYTNDAWQSILATLGISDWLFLLPKPFDAAEMRQLACALTERWNQTHYASQRAAALELAVQEKTCLLAAANEQLQAQVKSLAESNARLAQEASARQSADDRIRHIAYHDSLTDLPNRLSLMERIECCIDRSRSRPRYCFAVLYCDLDNFKVVNDSLGHRTGDKLLVQVARKLTHALRTELTTPRPAYDTVARLGGDEFVILLDEVPNEKHVRAIAERVRQSILQPTQVDDNQLVLGISIGIAINTGDYDEATDMLRDADTALYHAKDTGKGCIAVFDQEMRDKVTARLDLEYELRRAMERHEFVVYYQSIVSLEKGRIESVEALVRWNHRHRGLLAPDAFIAVAEETGLIDELGQFVLQTAIAQVAQWRSTVPGMENLRVSVNLSPRQLAHPAVVECINRCLNEFDLEPHALQLEITEAAMIHALPNLTDMLADLVGRGVQIHLDDFGTGYSSLSILHSLPFSTVKLDRSFISHLSDSLENRVTVKAVVMLAQNEGIHVVAEGIESHEQLEQLREFGCEYGQGFYFSRPLPTEDAETYLGRCSTGAFCAVPNVNAPATHPSVASVVGVF